MSIGLDEDVAQINIPTSGDIRKYERYAQTVKDFLKLGYSESESMALATGVLIEHRLKDEFLEFIDEWNKLGFRYPSISENT